MIGKWIALLLAFMLLTGSASAAAYDITLQAEKSDILSEGALNGLSRWLEKARLTVHPQESGLQALISYGDELLLAASDTVLTDGKYSVPYELEIPEPAQLTSPLQAVANLAAAYEKTGKATAGLGNIVKAKTQLSYELNADEWAALWPQITEILGDWAAGMKIESKGTIRRYFASDGSEIGGYFYAEKVRVAENDVRQVRLEYGYAPDKGLYLAFRCPNAKETRNVRVTMTVKISDRDGKKTTTVSADIRRWHDGDQDSLLIEAPIKETNGAVTGKAIVNYTRKRSGKTLKQALTVSHDFKDGQGTVSFNWKYDGSTALAGKIGIAASETAAVQIPEARTDDQTLLQLLTVRLLYTLQDIPSQERLQLIYYLNRSAYLTGGEKEIYITYDPEFTVTEEQQ